MADRQKLIAVCLSEAHSPLNSAFLSELGDVARQEGYGVCVFNSSMDLYWYQKDNPAPRTGYLTIRYELFDALIVICHSFHDDALVKRITGDARRYGVPVFCFGGSYPGCHTVQNDYEEGYKRLIRHVIRDHGARDTFFMAGMKNEENSEARLRCYREVLAEEGLPFPEENMAYGNYWAKPAEAITLRLIRTRKALPRAIICANDEMAIAVINTLRKNGFRVPEDVIVTGYDGSPGAYMIRPHLTTCGDNPRSLAVQILDLLKKHSQGEAIPENLTHRFLPVFAGSCGCPDTESDRYDPLTVFQRSMALNRHENDLYHKMERILMQRDSDSLLSMISLAILPDSYICINKRLLNIYAGEDYKSDRIEEDLLMIPFREPNEELQVLPCRLSALGAPEDKGTGITVFNTLHTGSVVCGFFAAHTFNLDADGQLIRRLADALNLIFAIHLGTARQRILLSHLDNSRYLDPVTGFSNLRGLTRWFRAYEQDAQNHGLPLCLSVFSIYRYNYIYESHGMDEAEEIVRMVGNRLSSSHPGVQIIARTGADQFAVVQTGENAADLKAAVTRRSKDFLRQLDAYNAASSRNYYVEVNSGSVILDPGWENTTLENLIHAAQGEMYMNRMRSSAGRNTLKSSAASTEQYSAFNLLMEKNLFRFFFQPIVDVRTAGIIAYEALMRTDYLINMTPMQILATAREYNRLYDVETATLFGIMERYMLNIDSFRGRKVFINTIPGHFLSEADCRAAREQFGSCMDRFVYELTEQDPTTDEELARLKSMGVPGHPAQIAIDDYGTGHSNIVSVLRYAPQIIKIDRALTAGIHSDPSRQQFMRNTIEFARPKGILTLAEGVETAEELRTVIACGIDLVQGYYTGRPAERPAEAVNAAVRAEILDAVKNAGSVL